MDSGSAITRSFRSRISFERGPGTPVLSSIALVVAIGLTIAQPAANLHTCIGELHCAPPSNTCRPLARDHAAPEPTLALSKAIQPCCGQVQTLAWCSRPRNSAALL